MNRTQVSDIFERFHLRDDLDRTDTFSAVFIVLSFVTNRFETL